ncbi:toprim domain-containing protein, partial [Escherichia coli]
QIREMYGRKIGNDLRKGTALHLYLPGAHGGVWNEQALIGSSTVILCESLIDAMSFWVAGFRNVTAAYGVNGFTGEMRAALRAHGVKQVLIAYDNDPAGNEAAVKLASSLAADGIATFRVLFPAGMDANGYLCQVAEPEQAFSVLLDGAVPMGDLADVASIAPQASAEPAHLTSLAADVAALPAVSAPAPGVSVETLADGELMVALPGERWTIRGVSRKPNAAAMKVNAQVLDTESGVVFADGVDMMSARSRGGYARAAAAELGLAEGDLRRSLGKVLLALEHWQAAPQPENAAPEMTPEDREAANEKSYITQLHQNAQRLLRPLNVVNPFASQLTFMSDKTRTRRDHMKYLTLIQAIALLHQYQREIKRVEHRGQVVEYIEVAREDIALANRLAHEILGRTLDEMPPQTRKLL